MSPRPSSTRTLRDATLLLITAAAALAGALAPVSLTGDPTIDLVERALFAGGTTFVGAHGRRWSWVVAGALIAIPARGVSLALALAGLTVLVVAAGLRRRSKLAGATGLALLVNAPLWLGPDTLAVAPLLVLAAGIVLVAAGNRHQRRARRRVTRWTLAGLGGLVLLGGALLAVAVLRASDPIAEGAASARRALQAARDGDADAARLQLSLAADSFGGADGAVTGPLTLPIRLVPVLAQQHRAVQVAVQEGGRVSAAGDDLVSTADYDRLRYEGRIDLLQIEALSGPTERTNRTLSDATDRLRRASGAWLLPPLDDRMSELTGELEDARRDTALAGLLFREVPDLLGGSGLRRYLVMFQTPAELRGGGGFVGAYAELTADAGRVNLTRSGPIRDLITGAEPGTRTIEGFDDYRTRYGSLRPEDYLQDVTYSPDFPTNAGVMAQLYPQSGGAPLHGVIGVDPIGLAALIELTGPIQVPGLPEPLTAENAAEVLLRTQYLAVPDEAARDEVLAEATRLTFEQLTSGRLPGPKQLGDVLSPAARSGHLRLWSPEPSQQALFERLGADGSLRIPRGADGFTVVQQNLGNNKLDAYLHRSISYDATVDVETGELQSTLTVELFNDAPDLTLPRAVVGNGRGLPVGTNLASLSVFTPSLVRSATIDGVPVTLAPSQELGLQAWDLPAIQIAPGAVVTVVLELDGAVDLRDGYRLSVLPQPVANPDEVRATLTVRGGRVDGADPDQPATVIAEGPLERPAERTVSLRR